MELSEVTSKTVPPELKKLVRMIGRCFYQPIHIACLDILSAYPCVTEKDLVEVLRLKGSQKILRQALTFLRKDKIIKMQQRMEDQIGLVHYYYINYKHFVNVVKYKLDKIRRNIETEERRVHSSSFYKCVNCEKTYTELDIDTLFNPADGSLRCSFCSAVLEEENVSSGDRVDSRALILKLNEQLRPITELLKAAEKVNLAPDVLEPEPSSIEQIQSRSQSRNARSASNDGEGWTRNRAVVDMYGESTDISVHMGASDAGSSKATAKAVPEWMSRSTVHHEDTPPLPTEATPTAANPSRHRKEDQIMADLLTHEASGGQGRTYPGPSGAKLEYSSSDSDLDDMEEVGVASSDSDDDQFLVKVGDRSIPLDQVSDALVAQMTETEKERYTQLYQRAMEDM